MLRGVLMAVGAVILMVAALLLLVAPVWTAAVAPGAVGIVIVGGLLLERFRYRATADAPPTEPGWEITRERFVDPDSNELMVVWYHRRNGKRLYVRSGPAQSDV